MFLKHPDGRAIAVPVHSGETLGPGLLRAILGDVEMSVDERIELL
ncbi:MAG TPA: type II toxin-antitoxin system HicA family toxin [Candidatus Acidoferrum sp.]